uniref:Uncharacterized protein n=1 Tax=Anopheles coluzzii TaxID=1518534 RepID=A0A8W7PZQ7_ANOCL
MSPVRTYPSAARVASVAGTSPWYPRKGCAGRTSSSPVSLGPSGRPSSAQKANGIVTDQQLVGDVARLAGAVPDERPTPASHQDALIDVLPQPLRHRAAADGEQLDRGQPFGGGLQRAHNVGCHRGRHEQQRHLVPIAQLDRKLRRGRPGRDDAPDPVQQTGHQHLPAGDPVERAEAQDRVAAIELADALVRSDQLGVRDTNGLRQTGRAGRAHNNGRQRGRIAPVGGHEPVLIVRLDRGHVGHGQTLGRWLTEQHVRLGREQQADPPGCFVDDRQRVRIRYHVAGPGQAQQVLHLLHAERRIERADRYAGQEATEHDRRHVVGVARHQRHHVALPAAVGADQPPGEADRATAQLVPAHRVPGVTVQLGQFRARPLQHVQQHLAEVGGRIQHGRSVRAAPAAGSRIVLGRHAYARAWNSGIAPATSSFMGGLVVVVVIVLAPLSSAFSLQMTVTSWDLFSAETVSGAIVSLGLPSLCSSLSGTSLWGTSVVSEVGEPAPSVMSAGAGGTSVVSEVGEPAPSVMSAGAGGTSICSIFSLIRSIGGHLVFQVAHPPIRPGQLLGQILDLLVERLHVVVLRRPDQLDAPLVLRLGLALRHTERADLSRAVFVLALKLKEALLQLVVPVHELLPFLGRELLPQQLDLLAQLGNVGQRTGELPVGRCQLLLQLHDFRLILQLVLLPVLLGAQRLFLHHPERFLDVLGDGPVRGRALLRRLGALRCELFAQLLYLRLLWVACSVRICSSCRFDLATCCSSSSDRSVLICLATCSFFFTVYSSCRSSSFSALSLSIAQHGGTERPGT